MKLARAACSASIALAALLSTRGASAQDATPSDPDEVHIFAPTPLPLAPETTTRAWTGWQTLTVDGIATALGGVSVALPPLAPAAIAGYALGAPIVHWSQGDVGKGFASLGVRLGIPTSGMLIGAAIGAGLNAGNTGWFSGPGWGAFFGGGLGLAIGLGAGVIVAPIVDATVLGWRDVPARKVGRRVVPTFAPAPRGGTVGFSATF